MANFLLDVLFSPGSGHYPDDGWRTGNNATSRCAVSNHCAASGFYFCNLSRRGCADGTGYGHQVIEQNMNGIDNLMYMSSTSDSAGSVTITLTFQSGTDPDIAQVQVQNKLQLATPLLPQEVQQQGISVEKSSSSFLMVAGFVSDNPNTTQTTSLTMSPLTLRTLSAV